MQNMYGYYYHYTLKVIKTLTQAHQKEARKWVYSND